MSKLLCAVLTLTSCIIGTANGQTDPGGAGSARVPDYSVDGLVLGSKIKSESAAYREYKCNASDQFEGFSWCQKSRRDGGARGPIEAAYSMLHSGNGTVAYANWHQQPVFFDAGEAQREIDKYSRKFGGSPHITRIPRRSGIDALIATWGKVELEPLDKDSVSSLGEGRSPKKGLLIDFVGNLTRSAQEGLPIYRIGGGAGFVWASSIDQRSGRGTLRFAAVDASALQSGLVTSRSETSPADSQRLRQGPAQSGAITTDERSGAEAAIARLQAELETAKREKGEAELARFEAQKVAQEAKNDSEIARKEVREVRGEVAAAREEMKKMKDGGGMFAHASAAPLLGVGVIGLLGLLTWSLVRFRRAFSSASTQTKTAEKTSQIDGEKVATNELATILPFPFPLSAAEKGPNVDQRELAGQFGKALGVREDTIELSSVAASAEADGDRASNPKSAKSDQDADNDNRSTKSGGLSEAFNDFAGSIVPA
jgi:hypothetical protein